MKLTRNRLRRMILKEIRSLTEMRGAVGLTTKHELWAAGFISSYQDAKRTSYIAPMGQMLQNLSDEDYCETLEKAFKAVNAATANHPNNSEGLTILEMLKAAIPFEDSLTDNDGLISFINDNFADGYDALLQYSGERHSL